MNLLVILRKFPTPVYTGFNIIVNNVLKRLSEKHVLKVLFLDEGQDTDSPESIKDFELFDPVICKNENIRISRFEKYYNVETPKLLWIRNRIETYRPDRILGFGYNLLGYFGLLDKSVPKILDIIDSEILYLFRDLKKGNIGQWKDLIISLVMAKKFVKKCDAVITVSSEDTENIKTISGCNNVYTIPNGVDYDYYCPDKFSKKIDNQIIFCGSLSFSPNQQGIMWFVKKCWNIILKEKPQTKLIIVGKSPRTELIQYLESFNNVRVIGFVKDIRSYMKSSVISIAPMVSGSGMKNKILEAWSLGLPVVTTPLGAKGVHCEHGKNILLAENPKTFSYQIIRLLDDVCLRDKLGAAGRSNVMENYSWQSAVDGFNTIIESVQNRYQ